MPALERDSNDDRNSSGFEIMNCRIETPFDNIENAQEYLRLLAETVAESKSDVENDITRASSETEEGLVQALRIVEYNLEKLQRHLAGCSRALNDLRTLRRLLLQERKVANSSERDQGAETITVPDSEGPLSPTRFLFT